MQLPLLSEIEKLRKRLGITQTELAKLSNVSQSLIARVETSSVDPRYSKVVQIFQALDNIKSNEVTATHIMSTKVVSIQKQASIEYAANKMKEHNVSQMPVLEDERIVGSFTERSILGLLSKGYGTESLSKEEVGVHMDDPFPSVKPETPLNVISTLLEHNAAVVVNSHGSIAGIITKADLLKVIKAG